MRVRFAPSPTGFLHIGGARTALLNYLFTKKNEGSLILRIEDTDIKRSSKEMVEEILGGLKWLGINWNEGPYYQSDNFEKYKEYADLLEKNKFAYQCFCSAEEIEERRNRKGNKLYKYDRKCLNLSQKEIATHVNNGKKPMLRFFIPEGRTTFKDKIHKELKVENEELEDFVLLKSDGSPTYHLSVVADDHDMDITHVIRGDDHLSNTFKQILLYRAMNFKIPKFFHLPLILGQDKKKLSKRHGETSILEFKSRGYLAEAFLTYLAQLSWNPGDYKKIFFMEELIEKIDFSKLSKNSPEFDYEKLRFLNSKAIQNKPVSDIYRLLIEDEKFDDNYREIDKIKKEKFINLIRPRTKTLLDIKEKFSIYFKKNLTYKLEDIKKVVSSEKIISGMAMLVDSLSKLTQFNAENVEVILRKIAEDYGIKAADLIHPSRLAITTETVSPGVFEVFEFFGKEDSIERLNNFIKQVKESVIPD